MLNVLVVMGGQPSRHPPARVGVLQALKLLQVSVPTDIEDLCDNFLLKVVLSLENIKHVLNTTRSINILLLKINVNVIFAFDFLSFSPNLIHIRSLLRLLTGINQVSRYFSN